MEYETCREARNAQRREFEELARLKEEEREKKTYQICRFYSVYGNGCRHDDWKGHKECLGMIDKCNRNPTREVE